MSLKLVRVRGFAKCLQRRMQQARAACRAHLTAVAHAVGHGGALLANVTINHAVPSAWNVERRLGPG